jgi:hypothetical protein
MRHLIFFAALAAACAGGCGSGDSSSGGGRAEVVKIIDAVAAAVPAKCDDGITWYEADNLFEYIDGDAPRFYDAGFARLAHTEWRPSGASDKAYVEMDIYDMAKALGALEIMADARADSTKYAPVGGEAHEADELWEVRIGQYYIKLTPRHDADKALVRALAEAVAKAAPAGPPDEQLVAPLPADKMAPHSATFRTKDFLGREYLAGVREAAYESKGARVRLFLMDAGDEAQAKAVLAEWRQSLPPQPVGARDIPNTVSYHDEFAGDIRAAAHGKWVAGAIGDSAAAQPLLSSFLKHLE